VDVPDSCRIMSTGTEKGERGRRRKESSLHDPLSQQLLPDLPRSHVLHGGRTWRSHSICHFFRPPGQMSAISLLRAPPRRAAMRRCIFVFSGQQRCGVASSSSLAGSKPRGHLRPPAVMSYSIGDGERLNRSWISSTSRREDAGGFSLKHRRAAF
jgi:hypothetical protein